MSDNVVLNAPATDRPLPAGWRWARLGDVCEINPRRTAGLVRADDAPTTFVPMPAVSDREGIIARPEAKPYSEVRKGYTYFEEGDVLFAKITPCMQNGKHAVACGLSDGIGFGSTEFHVLRPGAEITADWIHRFLRQPSVLLAATARPCELPRRSRHSPPPAPRAAPPRHAPGRAVGGGGSRAPRRRSAGGGGEGAARRLPARGVRERGGAAVACSAVG